MPLSKWPLRRPADWRNRVNRASQPATLEQFLERAQRGRPWGDASWGQSTLSRVRPAAAQAGRSRRISDVPFSSPFNKARENAYIYKEIPIVNPKGGRPNYLDSYDPIKGEIVSRKISQLSEIRLTSAKTHLRELATKYPPGAMIAKVPSAGDLAGKQLEGIMILEVPPQWKAIPQAVLREAARLKITIRDSNGRIYHAD